MKLKTALLSALVMLTFASCQKESLPGYAGSKSNRLSKHAGKKIEQKFIDLSDKQSHDLINRFKISATSRLGQPGTSLPIDTAIYVLEAALNNDFDWDLHTGKEVLPLDSIVYCCVGFGSDATSPMISSSDLENAYTTISAYVSSRVTHLVKVRVIDIQAAYSADGAGIEFKAMIILIANNLPNPCTPFAAGVTASQAKADYTTVFCTTPVLDGPPLVKQKLNCTVLNHSCRGYYSNVITISPSPGGWFYFSCPWANRCNPTTSTLNGTTLNSRRSTLMSSAIANKPATSEIISQNVTGFATSVLCACPNDWFHVWYHDVTYGKWNCKEPNQ
jgi:hypothetical protein